MNIVLAVAVFAAWLHMVYYGGGALASRGLWSLRYFTVLSNLLEGVACLCWLAGARRQGARHAVERLKYTAAVCLALTFLTVVVFLGPLFGYAGMFSGANFWFHLAVPLAAIAEQLFLAETTFDRKDNLLATIPLLIYGTGYLANNLINGIGAWPDTNDWYGFLTWGYPAGIVIFAVIILITWGLGALLRRCGRRQTGHRLKQSSGE